MGCNQQSTQNMKKKNLYEYINEDGNATYLVIEREKELVSGTYIGVEFSMNDKPFYYKSTVEELKIAHNNISFVLMDYMLSSKPIIPSSLEIVPLDSVVKAPLILEFKMYFSGEIKGDKIILKRSSDLYDSRIDLIELEKSNSKI